MKKTNYLIIVAVGLLCVLGAIFPMTNFLTTIVAAGALGVLIYKVGNVAAGITICISFVASYAISGSLGYAISSSLCSFGVGIAIGVSMKKGKSFSELMVITIVTATFINMALTALSVYLTAGVITLETLMAPYEQMFNTMEQAFVAAGNDAYAVAKMIGQVRDYMGNVLIGYMVFSSMMIGFFAFLITIVMLRLIYKVVFPQYNFLHSFKVSRTGGIVFFITFLALVMGSDAVLTGVAGNFVIIFSPIFLLGGLSLIEWNLNRAGMKRIQKILIYVCIFATLFLPYINLVNATVALGLMDSVINYRKMKV